MPNVQGEDDSDNDEVSSVYVHEAHGSEALKELEEMRRTGELVDCHIKIGAITIPCHRAVLAAQSPYFRAMFRNQEFESNIVELIGMEFGSVSSIIDYFYDGRLLVSMSTVSSLLSAADQLLLPWILDNCAKFLLTNLSLYTVLAAWRLASLYRLATLEKAAVHFCYTEFNRIVESSEWVEFEKGEIQAIISSDEIIVDENVLVDALIRWCRERDSHFLPEFFFNIRFPLCSEHFLWRLENDENYSIISKCPMFLQSREQKLEVSGILSRNRRCRGSNHILAVHHDASDSIYGYNMDTEKWEAVATIPEEGGYEYSCLTSYRTTLYVVGGRCKTGETLRRVYSYDLGTQAWTRLPDMNEVRWYHGALVLDSRLYAVAGCGQLNSIEVLYLADGDQMRWKRLSNMQFPRHMPGVGALKEKIFVVGGTDNTWTAQSTVEVFNTSTLEWIQLPDLQVPRIQPAVVGLENRLYVMGGRNSNKVELMSVEVWDPVLHSWTYCKEMHRKRWGGGGAALHNLPVVVGGRGKRAGQAEVYCEKTNSWSQLPGEIPCSDRCYSATMVQKPWSWSFPQ